jgi:hypothetical protein
MRMQFEKAFQGQGHCACSAHANNCGLHCQHLRWRARRTLFAVGGSGGRLLLLADLALCLSLGCCVLLGLGTASRCCAAACLGCGTYAGVGPAVLATGAGGASGSGAGGGGGAGAGAGACSSGGGGGGGGGAPDAIVLKRRRCTHGLACKQPGRFTTPGCCPAILCPAALTVSASRQPDGLTTALT